MVWESQGSEGEELDGGSRADLMLSAPQAEPLSARIAPGKALGDGLPPARSTITARRLGCLNRSTRCAPLGGAPDGAEKALWAIGTNEAEPVKPRASRAMLPDDWRILSVLFYTAKLYTAINLLLGMRQSCCTSDLH